MLILPFLASIVLLKIDIVAWWPFLVLMVTGKFSQSFIVTVLYNVMLDETKIDFVAGTTDIVPCEISRCLSHRILTVQLLLWFTGVRMSLLVDTLFVASEILVGWYHFLIRRAGRIIWGRLLCRGDIWWSERILWLLLLLFIGASCPITHTLRLIVLWI